MTHVIAVKVNERELWVRWRDSLGAVSRVDKDQVGQEELCVG